MQTHLIILDNDRSLANGLALFLRPMFDRISVFQTPINMQNHIHTSRQTVVISEINFPAVDGIQMLRELKRDFPQVRVVAFSAFFNTGILEELQLAGIDLILEKPVKMEHLKKEVKELIAH